MADDAREAFSSQENYSLLARVEELEARLETLAAEVKSANSKTLPSSLQTIVYRIGKLYVKELSGTLCIGVTSIGDEHSLRDLSSLPDVVIGSEETPESESWYRDEGWFDVGDIDD